MKNVKTATGITLSIMLLVAPQIAHAEEAKPRNAVEFKLLSSELKSENGRAMILSRMNQKAKAACRNKSRASYIVYARSCRSDLMDQWIAEIGNSALSAMTEQRTFQLADASK